MEEIKVNDYIRTVEGEIFKVAKIELDERAELNWYQGTNPCEGIWKNEILKHSPNIIDLIEERRLCEW